MSVRRNQVIVDPAIPPLLVQIINAARHAAKASTDRAGHDKVLADLSRWALVHVPNGGVLAPESDQAYQVIEQAAERHLGVKDARAALRAALKSLQSAEQRHDIEEAQNWLQAERDGAYYYAGLACGITLAQLAAVR
jgi:hypothetical protein